MARIFAQYDSPVVVAPANRALIFANFSRICWSSGMWFGHLTSSGQQFLSISKLGEHLAEYSLCIL